MIVPMKKAHILVLKEDQNKLLQTLQRFQILMPIMDSNNTFSNNQLEMQYLQRTENSIKLLSKYREKKSFLDYKEVEYEEFAKIDPSREELLQKVEYVKQKITELNNENESLLKNIKNFLPWQELDLKLSELTNTKYTIIHCGFIKKIKLENVKSLIDEFGSILQIFGDSDDSKAIIFINYYQNDKAVYQKIKSLGFIEISLPNENKFVSEIITNLEAQINTNNSKINELENRLKQYANKIDDLEILNDQILTKIELKKVDSKSIMETFYLEGWARSDQEELLRRAVEMSTQIYDLEICDPKDNEIPPTATKNNRFVEAFESITNLYAAPNYHELDPNPVMAPWYWIIFGMMVGDVGYGLVMILFFGLLINLLKPKGNSRKLIKTFQFSGITSIIWGILFGSYFGATWNPILLAPLNQPLEMLIATIILGGFHLITALIVKAFDNIQRKHFLDALFDQFSWVLILVGIGFLFISSLSRIGRTLTIIGALTIILTGGRKKKNIFGKIVGGFTSLFGITNYLSDVLSYSRIHALCLSQAVIAMVMNMLAGMLQTSIIGFIFSIIVYLIGHIFNISMGLLSAYVHDSRLQYIEFYGKFYEGGGYQFKPLSYNLKYIKEIKYEK